MSGLKKYARKPVKVRAIQYTGRNLDKIAAFAGGALIMQGEFPAIRSLESVQVLNVGEYVICNPDGAFYPTAEERFNALNEHIRDDEYAKKRVIKHAIRFDGSNFTEISEAISAVSPLYSAYNYDATTQAFKITRPGYPTPFDCRLGDYVIFGGGRVYPCNANIFEHTYEPFGVELETVQRTNKLNQAFAMDERGPGGAKHHYQIVRGDTVLAAIKFQCGPRNAPDSAPGVADEDLLEIVRDRLTDFQKGAFASQYNADALNHITAALMALDARVQDRAERGVLGKNEA